MSGNTREERLTRRIAHLYATDQQFSRARPNQAVTEAIDQHDIRLSQIVRTVMESYSDRPALAQRTVELVKNPQTGRTSLHLLPRFETITYRELWDRIGTLTTVLATDWVQPGDRVCVLGFASVDYTTIDLALVQAGAVSVPLQTSAPVLQLRPIVAETEPRVIATSPEYLDDAVELVLTRPNPMRLIVFDYHPEVDEQRDLLDAAKTRLVDAAVPVTIETLQSMLDRAGPRTDVAAFTADEANENDPLALLIYTSGSTGTPKGVMWPEHLVANTFWRTPGRASWGQENSEPSITLCFLPMSHGMGRAVLYWTLASGGTAYFTAKSDLSTLVEDLALVRPTQMNFVPRIWDMLFQEFQSQVDQQTTDGVDRASAETTALAELRQNLLGGRFVSALTSSAPISDEMQAWVESLVDLALMEGYGSSESGPIMINSQVRRPPVIDYKLVDVPELGYFRTDRPHPRGELLVKTENLFAGYYKRPEVTAEVFDADGYYRTGDVVAEVGPDQLVYVDRRNNVLKLAQGEFVAPAKLGAVFGDSPLIRQIYVYGNSAQPYLLAVVVPVEDMLASLDVQGMKSMIAESLQTVAKAAGLQSYEIPRDFIIETAPFTLENGLLTGIRKLAWPKLKAHYGERLEQLYAELADSQVSELRVLRQSGLDAPVLTTVSRAAGALLGASTADLPPNAHFTDLGGDSLSALTFGTLLREIFDIDVPVSVIVSPANDLRAVASYIEAERTHGSARPTLASIHGLDRGQVHAGDLTLDKFIDTATLAAAANRPHTTAKVRTVLLTGATGFLGRYLALEWLERMSLVDGTLICLVRAKDDATARERLDKTFDSGDLELVQYYQRLATDRLEVIAGDKGQPNLGLAPETWRRLASTVDLILDSAALVNHVLPYSELFGPNVLGTAELLRLALDTKSKPFIYVSTLGVGDTEHSPIEASVCTEDADIRVISPTRNIDDNYANGYLNSKWASEVLLREAHDLCGLPVQVFRCNMILAETGYAGQLNLPDSFTRLMLSVVATGIAPGSFYEIESDGKRQRAHYDGLGVDFIAQAISTLSSKPVNGFQTYHVTNPHDDGIGLDEYIDWLIDAGYHIERVDNYGDWLRRFETAMRSLPDRQRKASLLPLLHNYQCPEKPIRGSSAPTERFRSAVHKAKIGPDEDIPHISPPIVVKYITDLKKLGLL
jgi:fatty acid CoA ligase FadD9